MKKNSNKANDCDLGKNFKLRGFSLVAGVDEAGRGPLAGPVVASAVLLRESNFTNRIDDSKKLTALQRKRAFLEILNNADIGVGIVSEAEIDKINIFNASCKAMEEAVAQLMRNNFENICFIVDVRMKLNLNLPYECFTNAESKSLAVACASIISKVIRDRIMGVYDKLAPHYGFAKHKGYGTKDHFKAIKLHGPSRFHRKSFYPVSEYFV